MRKSCYICNKEINPKDKQCTITITRRPINDEEVDMLIEDICPKHYIKIRDLIEELKKGENEE